MANTKDVLEEVGKLIALGRSGDTEEARTAAVLATRKMAEHKLVLVPQSEIERVQKAVGEAAALAKKYESDSQQKMLLGALAGFMVAKNGLL